MELRALLSTRLWINISIAILGTAALSAPYSFAQAVEKPTLLLLGDSITSALGDTQIGKCAVVNLAEGGTGAAQNLQRAKGVLSRPDAVLIAVGVNDARRQNPPYPSATAWGQELSQLVTEGGRISKNIYLSTILPTETDKAPYGGYADVRRIQQMNKLVFVVAKKHGAQVIDAGTHFRKSMSDFTKDGVHPTGAGSAELIRYWSSQVKECQ